MYFIYNTLTLLILIISPIIFLSRLLKGKEDKKRFLEKFCIHSKKILQKLYGFMQQV